jgi:transcriptional regulator
MVTINATMKEIKVSGILNSNMAVSTEEGEKVYELIKESFNRQEQVRIDFSDLKLIISTFLNASIGQLYGIYSTEFIQQHLDVQNMSQDDLNTLKLVTDRAKEYFKDKRGFENVAKKNLPNAEE